MTDPYTVLGVPATASQDESEVAYKARLQLLLIDRSEREKETAARMLDELQQVTRSWATSVLGPATTRSKRLRRGYSNPKNWVAEPPASEDWVVVDEPVFENFRTSIGRSGSNVVKWPVQGQAAQALSGVECDKTLWSGCAFAA